MRLTDEHRARIHELRANGLTHRAIAKIIGCDHSTVGYELNPESKRKHREYSEQWKRDNPEQYYAGIRQWQSDNPDKVAEYKQQYQHNDPVKYVIIRAKYRASVADIPFDPAIKDELGDPPSHCPACDVEMSFHLGEGFKCGQLDSPSIDRIIPELGYVVGNVQWLCHQCNSTKRTGTMADLYERLAQ